MKQKQIWMAMVTDEGEVVFSRLCCSERKAEKTVVDYLRKERKFKCRNINDACFWIGEKDLPLNLMIFELQSEEFKDVIFPLSIASPPDEKDLYRVVYVIDVNASSPSGAAKVSYEIMKDVNSMPPVLYVIDNKDKILTIDLSEVDYVNRTKQ